MKKLTILLTLLLVLLSGCRGSAPEETLLPVPAETAETTPPETEAPFLAMPMPQTLDLSGLTSETLSVSFEEGDVYLDDTGVLRMDAVVYSYDIYDMADISRLQVGDSILLRGEPVLIRSIECTDSIPMDATINGGPDQGGCWLVSGENGTLHEIGYSDVKSFYPLGEVTLQISGDFEYTDRSDPDTEPRVWYPGDFLYPEVGIDYFFTPHNTTIRLRGGQVIAMERIYTP